MHKHPSSESGAFNPRIFLAFTLVCLSALLVMVSFASTPSSGLLTNTSGPLLYSAGPFTQSNPSPLGAGQLDVGPRCGGAQFPCDSYSLTINLPSGSTTGFPNAAAKVTASWTDAGSGQADYDLYIFKGDVATTSGNVRADFKSASGANPEIATIFPVVADGTPQKYTVKIVPYAATGETVNVKIEFVLGAAGTPPPPGGGGSAFGGPDPTVVGAPRYLNYYAPIGSSAEPSSGEFNIGFNPKTGRIMTMNAGPIWRLTPPELLAQAKPECCNALWEDRSFVATSNVALDPILFTDGKTGRTLAINNLSSPEISYAYSDNDGDLWNPIAGGPPNGADHETVGTGPLPASLSLLTTPLNQGQYAIFCSQTLVGANCERSLDLGVTYSPPIIATGPGALSSKGCGGLHGHVRIAPDGTGYLPDNSCGGIQGGAFTLDGSVTPWNEFVVEKTLPDADGPPFKATPQANGADPSIGIDKANMLYYCYVNNEKTGTEGHAHVAVGKRVGTSITWIRDTDVGAAKGIVNAAHTEAIAGDAGRAACGFFGTNVNGDYQKGTFPGTWYAFIATTFDEGRTWTTTNATPNDPIQSMTGIWQQGGSGDLGDRNLLDFNEVTMDDKGRVLYGYSDGCTSVACINLTAKSNLGAAMRVAHQSGGRSLLASFDPFTDTTAPILPKAPCLFGTRDSTGSRLNWNIPDNGGSPILTYNIYRGTVSGGETLLTTINADPAAPKFTDTTADPTVADYFYRMEATTAVGTGALSNEVDLKLVQVPVLVENVCALPGVTILTDAAGDSIGGPGTDLLAFRLAQPTADKLAFTINIDSTPAAAGAPGSFFYVALKMVNGATTTFKAVRMVYDPTPKFESYTPSGNSAGTVDGRFVVVASRKAADPTSSYDPVTGTIRIVVPIADLGLSAGSTINGFVSGAAQPANPTGTGANAVALYDQMPNSLAYTGSYTVGNATACSALQGAVSRKNHGGVAFDVPMPITGTRGIEPRSGGTSGAFSLVATFDRNVVVTDKSAATVSPSGSASVAAGPNPNQITVTLGLIPNAQHITVSIGNISDSTGAILGNLSIPMDVLLGDVNASGAVDGNDVSAVQSTTRQAVGAGNFKNDVNVTGRIDGNDVSLTQSATRTRLP